MFSVASELTQAGSGIAENAGRWVKLTNKSAQALQEYTPMKVSSASVHDVLRAQWDAVYVDLFGVGLEI